MKLRQLFYVWITIGITLIGCSDDDDPGFISEGNFQDGILVSHEGAGSVSGSVSFISTDFSDTENDIYQAVNGEELSVFQQSIAFTEDLAFVVVDNANTVTVVDRFTFEKVSSITTGLQTPRYMSFSNGMGYVTNWGDTASAEDDFVAIVDLTTYEVTTTIPVSVGPERIAVKNDFLYISHKGGFGTNNVVSVISTSDFSVNELEVGDNPDELEFDDAGNLWVLAGGRTNFDTGFKTAGALVKINTASNQIDTTINFEGTDQPSLMDYENGVIYYTLNGAVYQLNENENSLPSASIGIEGTFYGMKIKDDQLFTVDAKDFASNGTLQVFDLTTKEEIQSVSVGVAPAKIYFN